MQRGLWFGLVGIVLALGANPSHGQVTLFNYDVLDDATSVEPGDTLEPITIVGARNGTFSGALGVHGEDDITGLRASIDALTANGQRIDAEHIRIRYADRYPHTTRRRVSGLDVLLDDAPERSLIGVWVTVTVPADAQPGTYRGELTVQADGMDPATVDVELYVADWTLPDAQDFRTWIEILQSPDTLAIEYDVEMWSEEHWEMIGRSFELMAAVGNRIVYVPVMERTNWGNERGMIRWIERDGEHAYDWDFSIMQRYLELAEEKMGPPTHVVFNVWDVVLAESAPMPHHQRDEAREAREDLAGRGVRVTKLDPDTGELESLFLPRYEEEPSQRIWNGFFDELRAELAEMDLEQSLMLGVATDAIPSAEELEALHDASGGAPWVSHAHPNRQIGPYVRHASTLRNIAPLAYDAHVYRMGYNANPEIGERYYGWKQSAHNAHFGRNGRYNGPALRARILPEKNITGRQRGVGRIGGDFWFVLRDRRDRRSGAVYNRYPENMWRNLDIESFILAPGPDGPVGTARLENMREGVQECEARILIESVLLDDSARAHISDELADRAQALLDERQLATWRSVWPYNDDIEQLGRVGDHGNARNPIEAVWQALDAAGRDLPGYWDSEARQMRSEAGQLGRQWFVQSDWQRRVRELYDIAGEIDSILSDEGIDTYQLAMRLREQSE